MTAEIRLDPESPEIESLRSLSRILKDGGVGILPTDTVYGLVGLAMDAEAVGRIYVLKGRSRDKPLPVQVSEPGHIHDLVMEPGRTARKLMERFWPGPLTLIMKRKPGVRMPAQGPTLGIRMPDSRICAGLIREAGLLVAPSANLSGGPTPGSLREVPEKLIESVDFVVDGGDCPLGRESTVVDVSGELRIIREGAVSEGEVLSVAVSGEGESGGAD